jgi:hypothetical protein
MFTAHKDAVTMQRAAYCMPCTLLSVRACLAAWLPAHACTNVGEPALVSAAASLLAVVLQHNVTALSRLYLSGAFLFGLAYCGSNLTELAGLFKAAHLVQAFRCGSGHHSSVVHAYEYANAPRSTCPCTPPPCLGNTLGQ